MCKSLLLFVAVAVLALLLAPTPNLPPASPDGEILVLCHLDQGMSEVAELARAAGWQVSVRDEVTGLARLHPSGASAWARQPLADALALRPSVRAAESTSSVGERTTFRGAQSIFLVFDDELDLASVRPSPAYTRIGLPASAPPPSAYTPSIAVLDGGFSFGHEMLPGSAIVAQFDAVDLDGDAADAGNGVDDDADGVVDGGVGHGTAMAATIHTVCPHADLLCVRVLDDEGAGDAFSVAGGIAWAMANQVDVISLSFGMQGFSPVVDAMLAQAAASGIVIVAAAGNEPAEGLDFPASSPHVLAVTGVDAAGDADLGVNFDAQVFVSAPSQDVPGPFPGNSTDYGWCSGTSTSTAMVAGAVGLAIGEDPSNPTACVADVASAVAPLGSVPTERIGKHGLGVLDVGPIGAP